MLTASRPFSDLSELINQMENNNEERTRRISVDSNSFLPKVGFTVKLSGVKLLQKALKTKDYSIVKFHLGKKKFEIFLTFSEFNFST